MAEWSLHLYARLRRARVGARASILSAANEYFTLTQGLIAALIKFFENPGFQSFSGRALTQSGGHNHNSIADRTP